MNKKKNYIHYQISKLKNKIKNRFKLSDFVQYYGIKLVLGKRY